MQPFPKEWRVQVLFGLGESKQKGGTVKRVLLLAALCMALALVFAQVAVAQSRGPSGADGTYNCEDFDD